MRALKHEVEETRLRAIFASSPDAITVSDLNGNIVDCNQAALDMFGFSSIEELIGKNGFEWIAKKDHQQAMEDLKKILEQGSVKNIQYRCLTKAGHEFHAELSASVIKDSSGEPTGFVAITKDITERKKVEEELVRLSSAVKMSTDSIVISDLDGKIIDVNEATLKMYGTDDKGDLIGKSSFDLIVPEEREKAFAGMEDILEKGYLENREYHIIIKDGSRIPVEMSAAIMKDADGKPIGFVGISRDISDRRRAEEALRESEVKFRNIFESANDCMIYLDKFERILDVNKKAVEVFGGSKKELLGKHLAKVGIFSSRDVPTLMSAFEKILAGEEPTLNICIKSKRGQEIPLECSASLMKIDGKLAGILVIARDVTERKIMEKRIAYLASITDNAKVAIATVDMNGIVTYCNKTTEEMLGWTSKEVIGKPMARLCPNAGKQIEATVKEGFCLDKELDYLKKDGSSLLCSTSTFLIKGKDGNPVGVGGIAIDITERKQMEEKLGESEEKFRNLYESIQEPLAVYVGREGRILEYNEAFKKRLGYTDEELKYKTFLDFLHPDDLPLVLEKYRTKYPEEELPLVYEIRGVNKKGEIIPIEISVSTYKVKGKVVGIEVIHRDITERKQMEQKLRQYSEHLEELVQKRTEELLESEKRYSVLVEEARDGVGIIQDGKLVFVNKTASEIYGYSRDELMGFSFLELVDKKYHQLVMERYTQRLRGEKVLPTYEIEIVAKNGERVPVELSATHINYQGRSADLVIARDISERKRMEEERLRLEKLATIGELATMVGHDLRNPLQAIENATYYLNNELPRLLPSILISQKAVEMLEIINNSVNYADKIIKDLHDFSATKQPTLKETNINTIVEETLTQVETPENIELTTELAHLPKVKADKDMIKRAFLNLTINAIQAMENGGTLKVSTKKTGGMIEVSFKDTGIGMSKESMKKIFTPFFTTRAKGMGMGLPICKKFVEIHGGNIQVESKEGKGRTFTVKLPIQ